MPPFYIIIPCLLIAGFSLTQFDGSTPVWLTTITIIIPISIAAAAFVLRAAINEWWITRFPRRLNKDEQALLTRFSNYYRQLNPDLKAEFERRLYTFRVQKELTLQGIDEKPTDIELFLYATAIQLTFGFRDFIYPDLGAIVLFPKAFGTPERHDWPHAVEYKKDEFDCVIIAVDNFTVGMVKPHLHYQVGLHGFALAWQNRNDIKDSDIPYHHYAANAYEFLEKLGTARGFVPNFQSKLTGTKELEVFGQCIEHFFQSPQTMKDNFPEVYSWLSNLLNQDVLFPDSPVIQSVLVTEDAPLTIKEQLPIKK